MDSRKQFEDFSAWYAEYEKQRSAKGWMPLESHIVNHMSICWHASRESLVVELPDPFWPGYVEEDEPGLCISTDLFTIEQLTQVLAGYGIRTK